jgi:uncharacterized membrane protein YoaK (UPF0700 family)
MSVGIRRAGQTSESVELAVLLALSGGFMDAYSYLARGQVFANAQTGNMLLLGLSVADGDWSRTSPYAIPILCFAVGVAIAHVVCIRSRNLTAHWRQACLLLEIALLVAVAFIPAGFDRVANCLTSLACGIQVQSFRKLHGRPFATTMCMGNMRSGMQELIDYIVRRETRHLEGAVLHFGTIFCFVCGAVVGSRAVAALGTHAMLASAALLLIAFLFMFWDREEHTAAAAERRYLRERRRRRR